MKFFACFVISCVTVLVTSDQRSLVNSTSTLWNEGKVPYEISQQFVTNDSIKIELALIEIMRATCIKFVPRTNESDYAVFVKYKHSTQERGTCWSGKWTNDGNGTIGNQKGRHIISLWPDLENCFNTLDIIREILNLLGLQTKQSRNPITAGKSGKQIIYNMYFNYEENLAEVKKSFLGNSCETDFKILKNHTYAMDMKELVLASKRDSCRTMKQVIEINQLYSCHSKSTSGNTLVNVSSLASVGPNCTAEIKVCSCKSDPVYMNAVCSNMSRIEKSMCEGASYLINGRGKCLYSIDKYSSQNGNKLVQWDCGLPDNGQLWSWNEPTFGSGDRHLCNGHKKCATSPYNSGASTNLVHWDYLDENAQRFNIFNQTADGFFMIKNDYGKCLGIAGDRKYTWAEAWVIDCNTSEKGQHWKWHQL